uniref:Uncharacterized protein n=1 Tax=Octopus bimaculoides TaxID=37653 RepID=A0A0L8HVF0_OCTBM
MLLMKIFIFLIVVYFNEAEDCVKLNVTINNTMTTMQYIVFGEFNYTTAEKKCLKCNGHLFHVYTKEKMMRLRGHIESLSTHGYGASSQLPIIRNAHIVRHYGTCSNGYKQICGIEQNICYNDISASAPQR